jgi:hypothetical protein
MGQNEPKSAVPVALKATSQTPRKPFRSVSMALGDHGTAERPKAREWELLIQYHGAPLQPSVCGVAYSYVCRGLSSYVSVLFGATEPYLHPSSAAEVSFWNQPSSPDTKLCAH